MLLVPTRLAPSTIHGLGVFAAEAIAKNTPVWRFAAGLDLEIDPRTVDDLPAHTRAFLDHYGYVDRNRKTVILCFDHARFINHAPQPNLVTDYGQNAHGLDIALRDIEAGEELTLDYAGFEEPGFVPGASQHR